MLLPGSVTARVSVAACPTEAWAAPYSAVTSSPPMPAGTWKTSAMEPLKNEAVAESPESGSSGQPPPR